MQLRRPPDLRRLRDHQHGPRQKDHASRQPPGLRLPSRRIRYRPRRREHGHRLQPEATSNTPTQCIALAVDNSYIRDTVHYLNDYYNSPEDEKSSWELHFDQYHSSITIPTSPGLIDKLIRICTSSDNAKNIYADLNSLKELLILHPAKPTPPQPGTSKAPPAIGNSSRLHFDVLQYIHDHLTERDPVDTAQQKGISQPQYFLPLV